MQHVLRVVGISFFLCLAFFAQGQFYNTDIRLISNRPLCSDGEWCTSVMLWSAGGLEISGLKTQISWDENFVQFSHLDWNDENIDYTIPDLSQSDFTLNGNTLDFFWETENSIFIEGDEYMSTLFDICWTIPSPLISYEEWFTVSSTFIEVDAGRFELEQHQYPEFPPSLPSVLASNVKASLKQDEICVPILVDGFLTATAAQFHLAWDTNILALKDINVDNSSFDGLSLDDISVDNDRGIISVNWEALNGKPLPFRLKTLRDYEQMFELRFDIISPLATTTHITFVDEAATFIDNSCAAGQPLHIPDIEILILEDITSFSFTDTIISANTDLICVPTKLSHVDTVLGLQLGLIWDSEVIQLNHIKVDNSVLPGLSAESDFGILDDNRILLSWIDPNFTGVKIEQKDLLFETCFDIIGRAGTETTIRIDTNRIVEVITEDTAVLEAGEDPGHIRIREESRFMMPGDANEDKITNHFDLLHLGLAYQTTGTGRENTTINWERKYSRNWAMESPLSEVNYKHSDTNGDERVDEADVQAILQNWGESIDVEGNTYAPTEFIGTAPFAFQVPMLDATIPQYHLALTLDSETIAAYGLAFSLSYDFDIEDSDWLQLKVENTWLGTLGEDLISVQRHFPEEKRIDVALTRIDSENRSGSGEIATLSLDMTNLILPILNGENADKNLNFNIHDIRFINTAEEAIEVEDFKEDIDLATLTSTRETIADNLNIQIYPNPSQARIQLLGDVPIERVLITTLTGKVIKIDAQMNSKILSIQELEAGLYFLNIYTEQGLCVKRFVKL